MKASCLIIQSIQDNLRQTGQAPRLWNFFHAQLSYEIFFANKYENANKSWHFHIY